MYKQNKMSATTIAQNISTEGETVEKKVRRILSNNEPISDGAPVIYTDRKDGVLPQYDIRTDRMEVALDAMGAVQKSMVAKRMTVVKDDDGKKDDGKPESIEATS